MALQVDGLNLSIPLAAKHSPAVFSALASLTPIFNFDRQLGKNFAELFAALPPQQQSEFRELFGEKGLEEIQNSK